MGKAEEVQGEIDTRAVDPVKKDSSLLMHILALKGMSALEVNPSSETKSQKINVPDGQAEWE